MFFHVVYQAFCKNTIQGILKGYNSSSDDHVTNQSIHVTEVRDTHIKGDETIFNLI